MKQSDLLVSEVAKIVGCHINTVLNYSNKGVIEFTRDVYNRRRYTLAEVEKLKALFSARWRDRPEPNKGTS